MYTLYLSQTPLFIRTVYHILTINSIFHVYEVYLYQTTSQICITCARIPCCRSSHTISQSLLVFFVVVVMDPQHDHFTVNLAPKFFVCKKERNIVVIFGWRRLMLLNQFDSAMLRANNLPKEILYLITYFFCYNLCDDPIVHRSQRLRHH